MKADEIDEIIANAVAESKGKSVKANNRKKNSSAVLKARSVLNILFMLGFLAAIIIYFAMPEQKALFFTVGFGALLLKLIEFALRFLF
jgi:hypothetical protein